MAQPTVSPHSETIWNEIEVADHETIRKIQAERLTAQTSYLAANSEFYRRKSADSGVDLASIDSVEALRDFPFTEKQELRDSLTASPPLGLHQTAPWDGIVQVQASSGTTGSPSYVGLTTDDVQLWNELGARALYANGFRPGDLMLHAFGMSKGFVGGIPVSNIAKYMGLVDLPIGAEAGVERLLRVAKDFRPQTVIGTPYFLIYLAEKAPEIIGVEAKDLGVRSLSIGGEPGGGLPNVRGSLESLWGATSREMLGGTDLGVTFWGECAEGKGMHNLFSDLILTELIDPDTGDAVPIVEGASGELVYTALTRQASPLLRFRTRDHVVVTGTDCACGRTGYTVVCVGRTDDMLIVRGINVFPSAVKELVSDLMPRTSGELRIIADFEGHSTQENLKIQVEVADSVPADEHEQLAAELHDKIRSALNFTPKITLVPEYTFPRPDHVKVQLVQRTEGQS
ncbi:phenylacetate--CoA ligase family protein [Brevibacterium sp. VCM10]|uniref:phenylacetate--CoA ligase family protein n=1 Tax=Brevibacterium sp. VCM10 TaxID=1381751 RepID=UPI00046EB752|nr:phenylacetate--CoA ligase family protein [Brevibacterium sp. VCM10]